MEKEFIDWLAHQLPPHPLLKLGAGDDAAIVAWSGGADLVATTDAITDQVDFHLAEVDPRRIGRKALAVNLSDLAAMAATPVAALVTLVLPRQGGAGRTALQLAQDLYHGMLPLAEEFDCVIAGGDTNCWEGPLAISVTALGRAGPRGPLLRSGARPGDVVLTTGSLGGSILGKHFDLTPRVREALALVKRYDLTAGLDLSDGLALDASRLAAASGCGIVLDLATVPIAAAAAELAATTKRSPLDHALGDGEDFELLLTANRATAERILREQPVATSITAIGRCIETPGLWQAGDAGDIRPLAATGYWH